MVTERLSHIPQVTSYGGELRFTVTQQPQPSSEPLRGQPLVVLQGNGITLEHHTSREPAPRHPSPFTVPFREVSPSAVWAGTTLLLSHTHLGRQGLASCALSLAASVAAARRAASHTGAPADGTGGHRRTPDPSVPHPAACREQVWTLGGQKQGAGRGRQSKLN